MWAQQNRLLREELDAMRAQQLAQLELIREFRSAASSSSSAADKQKKLDDKTAKSEGKADSGDDKAAKKAAEK